MVAIVLDGDDDDGDTAVADDDDADAAGVASVPVDAIVGVLAEDVAVAVVATASSLLHVARGPVSSPRSSFPADHMKSEIILWSPSTNFTIERKRDICTKEMQIGIADHQI